jgi:hypothetical protein
VRKFNGCADFACKAPSIAKPSAVVMPVKAGGVLFAGMPECNCLSHGWRVLHEKVLLLTFGTSKVRRFAIQSQEQSAIAICAMTLCS